MYEAWGRGDWAVGPEVYGPRMVWGWSDEFPEIHGTYSADKALVAAGLPPG